MTRTQIVSRLRDRRGQALVEFLFILPLVLLLILNLVNFGGFFYAWITVANAARAGANYAIEGASSAAGPSGLSTPTVAQITAVVQNDTNSLPNSGSLSVVACQNKNGTSSVFGGTASCPSSTPPDTDPEGTAYTLVSVDVTYTYVPFIRGFTFPNLGVYLTIPPTTIKQRAEMRQVL